MEQLLNEHANNILFGATMIQFMVVIWITYMGDTGRSVLSYSTRHLPTLLQDVVYYLVGLGVAMWLIIGYDVEIGILYIASVVTYWIIRCNITYSVTKEELDRYVFYKNLIGRWSASRKIRISSR